MELVTEQHKPLIERFYIPYHISGPLMECRIVWERMEGSCALKLADVISMILLEGSDNHDWCFQSITLHNGFVYNEFGDDILSQFDAWVILSDGVIVEAQTKWQDLQMLRKCKHVGYRTDGITVTPASQQLIYNITHATPGTSLQFRTDQIDDLVILQHLE